MLSLSHDSRTQALPVSLLHHLPRVDLLLATLTPSAGFANSLCSSLQEADLSQKPPGSFPSGPIRQDWVAQEQPILNYGEAGSSRGLPVESHQEPVLLWE